MAIDMTSRAGALARRGSVARLVLLFVIFVLRQSRRDPGRSLRRSNQAVTDLPIERSSFWFECKQPLSGNTAFYTDVEARLAMIQLPAQLYTNNQSELKEIAPLFANLDNLAALHRVGPRTGTVRTCARQLIEKG
jgi:hypothetical protein